MKKSIIGRVTACALVLTVAGFTYANSFKSLIAPKTAKAYTTCFCVLWSHPNYCAASTSGPIYCAGGDGVNCGLASGNCPAE